MPTPLRREYFERVGPSPETWHWVALWFNALLLAEIITTESLIVQVVASFVYLFLVGAMNPVGWRVMFPTLAGFSQEVLYLGNPRVYSFLEGKGLSEQARKSEVHLPVSRCLEMSHQSSVSTIRLVAGVGQWKPWMATLPAQSQFSFSIEPRVKLQLLEVMPMGSATQTSPLWLTFEIIAGIELCAQLVESSASASAASPLQLTRARERQAYNYNICLPPLGSLQGWELPPICETTTHKHMVATFLLMSVSTPGVPLLVDPTNPKRVHVPYVNGFDARALRQAGYAEKLRTPDRQSTWTVGGMLHRNAQQQLVPFDAALCESIAAQGEGAIRQAVACAVFFNSVLETYISSLDSSIVVNANTTYELGCPSEAEITAKLLERIEEIGESCLECMLAGFVCDRDDNNNCLRCVRLGLRDIRAQCVHAFSDQEAKQRSGLGKLYEQALTQNLSLPNPKYCYFGFGVRHLVPSSTPRF